jgi:hypothetical protein
MNERTNECVVVRDSVCAGKHIFIVASLVVLLHTFIYLSIAIPARGPSLAVLSMCWIH